MEHKNQSDPGFMKAAGIIDKNKSGNPDEWYRPGTLKQTLDENGTYVPYIDQVLQETDERFPELKAKVQKEEKALKEATFTQGRELTQEEKNLKMDEEDREAA